MLPIRDIKTPRLLYDIAILPFSVIAICNNREPSYSILCKNAHDLWALEVFAVSGTRISRGAPYMIQQPGDRPQALRAPARAGAQRRQIRASARTPEYHNAPQTVSTRTH